MVCILHCNKRFFKKGPQTLSVVSAVVRNGTSAQKCTGWRGAQPGEGREEGAGPAHMGPKLGTPSWVAVSHVRKEGQRPTSLTSGSKEGRRFTLVTKH